MSVKDTARALQSSFASSAPLPEELQTVVETFLIKHPTVDDADAQRLHDELLAIYQRNIAGFPGKHGPFVTVLRQIRPAIKSQDQLGEWWELVIRPTIDSVGHKRDTVEDAKEFVLSILVFDSEDDKTGDAAKLSAHFLRRLLDAYLVRTRIPTRDGPAATPEDDFVAHEIESVLLAFGRKKPKELLAAINDIFVTKQYRTQSLGLLSSFVRLQPPHLYLVLETPLVDNLLRCLLTDTSAIAVDLALTVLIMFLPHITSALVSYLPRLLLVYTRILCWDRYGAPSKVKKDSLTPDMENQLPISDAVKDLQKDQTWEQLEHSTDSFESNAPRVPFLFTFLYGLFPINFMSFIRKPRKYLKQTNLPGAEHLDFDQDIIRTRTEPYRNQHLLHPGFYMSTAEEELNPDRWLKSDPADLVTECMGLCVAVSSSLRDPGPPPTAKLPELPPKSSSRPPTRGGVSEAGGVQDDMTLVDEGKSTFDSRSKASWRYTRSTAHGSISSTVPINIPSLPKLPLSPLLTKMRLGSPDSPTLPPIIVKDSDDDVPEKLLSSSRPASSVWRTGPEVTSPLLETFTEALSRVNFPDPPLPALSSDGVSNNNIAVLQRELMLLRNDLNFERYLKQQHLSHIGALQRKQIKDAATDAETQNLIHTNKLLKQKLLKSNQAYLVLKKEFQTGRNQSKKWESDLSGKVRNYREEEKQWQHESQSLKVEFEKLKRDSEHLRRMVVESEARELFGQQKLISLEQDLAELEKLKKEVTILQERVRQYEAREMEYERTAQEKDNLGRELEVANMKVQSREHDRDMQAQVYERQIMELETRLRRMMSVKPDQMPTSVQQMLDSALAASQAQMAGLKRGHQLLLARYMELEARYFDVSTENAKRQETAIKSVKPAEAEYHHRQPQPPASQLGRKSSVTSNSSGGRGAFFKRHAFADPSQQMIEDEEYNDQVRSPTSESLASPTERGLSNNSPGYNANHAFARPSRFEAQGQIPRSTHRISTVGDYGLNPEYDYDSSSGNHSGSGQNSIRDGLHGGSGGHDFNLPHDHNERRGDIHGAMNPASKVTPESRVRVYGRGGHQNIGKKVKEGKPEKKPTTPTTSKPAKLGNSLRSMRGFAS